MLHLEKFSPYTNDKDLERRFHDITSDYDKSPPPTANNSPVVYPTLNGTIFENGVGDLNGNTKSSLASDALTAMNQRTAALNAASNGQIISNLSAHNIATSGSFQLDRKFLQFTTDQVSIKGLFG